MSNPLVEFLGAYGPQASSNNPYDAFVVQAAARTGCAPLTIEQPLVAELEVMFRSDAPRSVILTGAAGDGKTCTARKLVEALGAPGRIFRRLISVGSAAMSSVSRAASKFASASVGGIFPIGSSRRRLLNQSTHSDVACSTASKLRQGVAATVADTPDGGFGACLGAAFTIPVVGPRS